MAILKLFIPLLAIIVMVAVTRWKRMPPEALGVTRPVMREMWLWIGIWLVVLVIEEVVVNRLHISQPKVWHYPLGMTLLRILAIGIIGPIAEELAFRGVILHALRERLKVPVAIAIAITAAGWAAIHTQYSPPELIMIFIDGLILGTARVRSRSVITPCVMHIIGNLFSIWESIHGIPW